MGARGREEGRTDNKGGSPRAFGGEGGENATIFYHDCGYR